MKEINLGRILVENRHKRGITQDELAAYMGVSKAAVSKWETGMTYPDISPVSHWPSCLFTIRRHHFCILGLLFVCHFRLAFDSNNHAVLLDR